MISVIIAIGPGNFRVISVGFCGVEAGDSSGCGNKGRVIDLKSWILGGDCKHSSIGVLNVRIYTSSCGGVMNERRTR